MKKSSHTPKAKKGAAPKKHRKHELPVEDSPPIESPTDEPALAVDHFEVAGREEDATSTGHRIEPVVEDDEHNAEKLIEESLHGYLRASPNHTHRGG